MINGTHALMLAKNVILANMRQKVGISVISANMQQKLGIIVILAKYTSKGGKKRDFGEHATNKWDATFRVRNKTSA